MGKHLNAQELLKHVKDEFPEYPERKHDIAVDDVLRNINRWLRQGKGVAVYQNEDLGHPELGKRQFVSFGSPDAQLEVEEPPGVLPDIGGAINWRFVLQGWYREEEL